MKKLLLTLSLVLGFFTVAQADDVTFPESGKDWSTYGSSSPLTILDYTFAYTNGSVKSTDLRVFSGAQLIVTAPNGKTFNKVVVNGAKGSKATTATAKGWTVETNNQTGANTVITFTAAEPKTSITIQGKDNNGDNTQLRIAKMVITEVGAAGSVAQPSISCSNNLVTITAEEGDIFYTLDGTEPTNQSTKYENPFEITKDETVKAIAVVGDKTSSVATVSVKYIGTYDGFAAFVAAGEGAEGKVNGPVYFIYANATGTDVQVKDSKGGYMLIYRPASVPAGLVNGDAFAYVQGKYSPYNNLPEVASATFGDVTKGGAPIAPEEPGLEEISAAMANTYVKLSGVSISSLSGKSFTITDADGNTVKGYNTFNLAAIPEGENQTIIGFVRVFKTDVQIAPVTIESGVVVPVVETPVFSVAAGAVKKGTEVTISCATEGATIHYTTDGSFVSATSPVYSEPIVINEAMTIKAIAVKEGMTDSKLAQAAYTIKTETPVGPTTGTTATFTFSDPSTLTPAYTLDQAVDDGTTGNKKIDVNDVTFVANGAKIVDSGTGNAPRLYYQAESTAWTYRVYKNSVMTMTAPAGYKFTSIVFEPQTTSYANQLAGANVFSAGTYDAETKTLSFGDEAAVSEVTYTPAGTTGFNTITYNFAVIVPDAPEVVLPSDFTGTKDQIDLDNYKPANPEDPAHLWFNVDVTWKEGLKLHYRTTSWGAKLNGKPLKASTTPATAAYAAGTTDKQSVEYTGTIESGRSATFSFGSQGVFECYTENEYGHQSDPETVSFIGEATGVEDIVAGEADGEAVFYNMQGVRVANPAAGNLYIKVQGDKATKVLVK